MLIFLADFVTLSLQYIYIYIYIYMRVVQSTDTCSTAHQCSLVQSGYGMATIYTQVIVSDNRLWDNSCLITVNSSLRV